MATTEELNGMIKFIGEEGKDINIFFNLNDPIKTICNEVIESLKSKHNYAVKEEFESVLTSKINEIIEKNKKNNRRSSYLGQNSNSFKHLKTIDRSNSNSENKHLRSESSLQIKTKKKVGTRISSCLSNKLRDNTIKLYKNYFKSQQLESNRLQRAKDFLIKSDILRPNSSTIPDKTSRAKSKGKISDKVLQLAITMNNEESSTQRNNHTNNYTFNINKQESSYSLGKRVSNNFMLSQPKLINSKEEAFLSENLDIPSKEFPSKNNWTIEYAESNRWAKLLKVPSFDNICVYHRKMKRILPEKEYKYMNKCCIVRAEAFSYNRNKFAQKTNCAEQLNSSVFDMSSVFGARGKRGNKPGYTYLAAKNNLKRQESLMSKDKDFLTENSILQSSYKLPGKPNKNISNKDIPSTFKKGSIVNNDLNSSKISTMSKRNKHSHIDDPKEVGKTNNFASIFTEIIEEEGIMKKNVARKNSKNKPAPHNTISKKIANSPSKSKIKFRSKNNQVSSFNSKFNLEKEKAKALVQTISREHSFLQDEKGQNISMIGADISSKSLNQLIDKKDGKDEDNKDDKEEKKHINFMKSKKSLNNTMTSLGLGSFNNTGNQLNLEKISNQSNKSLNQQTQPEQFKAKTSNKNIESLILENDSSPNLQAVQSKSLFSITENKSVDILIQSNINVPNMNKLNFKGGSTPEEKQTIREDNFTTPREILIEMPNLQEEFHKISVIEVRPNHMRPKSMNINKLSSSQKSSNYFQNPSLDLSKQSAPKKVNKEYLNNLYQSKRIIDMKKSKNFNITDETTRGFTMLHINNPSIAKTSIENIDTYIRASNDYRSKNRTINYYPSSQNSNAKNLGKEFYPRKYPLKSQTTLSKQELVYTAKQNEESLKNAEQKEITNHIVNSYIDRYYDKLLTDLYHKVVDTKSKLKSYDELNLDEQLKTKFLEPIISIFYEKNLVFSLDKFIVIGKMIVKELLEITSFD